MEKKAGSCVWCVISPSTDLLNSHTCWQGLEKSALRASHLHVACRTRLFVERWTRSNADSHFSHLCELSRASEESFWWEPCWDIPITIAGVSSWRDRQLRWSVPTHSGGVICCWIHPITGAVSSSHPLGLVGHSSALCPPGPRTASFSSSASCPALRAFLFPNFYLLEDLISSRWHPLAVRGKLLYQT